MVARAVFAPQWLTARWSVVVGALVVLPHLVAGQQAVDLGTASFIFKPNPIGGGGGVQFNQSRQNAQKQIVFYP